MAWNIALVGTKRKGFFCFAEVVELLDSSPSMSTVASLYAKLAVILGQDNVVCLIMQYHPLFHLSYSV